MKVNPTESEIQGGTGEAQAAVTVSVGKEWLGITVLESGSNRICQG